MKKYLMIAVAALAVASCSKSDDVYDENRNRVTDAYNAAFLRYVGGSIDSNQDWGFGPSTTTRAAAPAFTRATSHNIDFPDAPAASDYKTTYPDGTPNIQGNPYWGYSAGGSFYADEGSTNNKVEVNPGWDGTKNVNGGPVYIVTNGGNGIVAPSYFYVDARNEGGAYVYVCPGATLKLNANDSKNLQAGLKMYIAEGATLETADELYINSLTIYNAGTIKAPNLHANGTGILYNQGTVTVAGNLRVTNANSFIVNEGKITAKNYGSEGSGSFWNVSGGEVNISEKTIVNSNSNGWVNDGQYTTGTFLYNAGSINVWNNCKLTCTTLFDMTLGDSSTSSFQMDGGASVVAASFHIQGPARIIMGANSMVKVTGTATMDCTKADYGIYGPTSGYAVFQANKIVKGRDNQGYEVTYGNNLYVYSETTHFENGMSGQYPYIDFVGNCSEANIYASNANFSKGKPAIDIDPSACNPGFEGGTPSTDDIRIMVEDLSAAEDGDFDFNDVVFDVKFTSETTADVTLIAAGGTLPLTVAGQEVHAKFGNYSTNTMINTNAAAVAAKANAAAGKTLYAAADNVPTVTFPVSGINKANNGKDIEVKVKKGDTWYLIEAKQGEPAAKFGCDPKVNKVDEQVSFKAVYDKFTKWVQNKNVQWY